MKQLLETHTLSRIRRNHGLEHATIHVLTAAKKTRPLAGHSDAGGFWIMGELETEELLEAVQTALSRLRAGERQLAVHPNCGTNFVTYGTFAGIGAFAAFAGAGNKFKDKLERLPMAAVLSTLALIIAQPLAFTLQREVTTSGDPQGLKLVEIRRTAVRGRTAHRIVTEG